MYKKYSDVSVYDAAKKRFDFIYENFDKVYISFSGGKDSGVMLNMAIEAARRHNKLPIDVLIVDLEAQYNHTVEYITRTVSREEVNAYWVCLPIHLRNAVSQYQTHWVCWDEEKRDAWVLEYPDHPSVIKDINYFPFFRKGMEFEEFVRAFGE